MNSEFISRDVFREFCQNTPHTHKYHMNKCIWCEKDKPNCMKNGGHHWRYLDCDDHIDSDGNVHLTNTFECINCHKYTSLPNESINVIYPSV